MYLVDIRNEIESLHEFFCKWFGGTIPQSSFETDFSPRFSEELVFIPPAGRYMGFSDLQKMIYQGYASNPNFRIQIRNVQLVRHFDNYALATYEEWQKNALVSTPPNNGRIASVLFRLEPQLQWLHIHETWLPQDVVQNDPYDF